MLLEAQLGQQHREKGLVPTAVFVPILKGATHIWIESLI